MLAESRFVIDAVPAGIWWFAAPTAGDGIDYCTAFTSSTPEGAAKYRWSSWRRAFHRRCHAHVTVTARGGAATL
ncbi:hypothetical protein I552_0156 [Mycobacterium xenopi 3993]|nr:hypothetical protein I552_0156 [Mycobacterium xenopi 3993]